jgi:UDP-GlcNAc:undecaprenyl-phosphate/decaprenyl-phosphate GlcNAc-1-phosphate transferase
MQLAYHASLYTRRRQPVHFRKAMKRSKKSQRFALWTTAAVVLAVAVTSLMIQRAPRVYPHLVIHVSDSLRVNFLHQAQRDEGRCAALVDRVLRSVLSQCPHCQVLEKGCVERLTPRQRSMLTSGSLDIPMVRLPGGGAITFEGAVTESALQNCVETGRQAAEKYRHKASCSAPTENFLGLPVVALDGSSAALVPHFQAFAGAALLAALVAFLMCLLIVFSDRLHGKYTHDHVRSGPQKFHTAPTPRIGGIAIVTGLACSVLVLSAQGWITRGTMYGTALLALASLPATLGGFAEDVTKRVGVVARLILTIGAGILAAVAAGAVIERVGIPGVDALLGWPVIAIAFTAIAVGGVANGFNLIDGYNGLASGYAILVLAVIAIVSAQVGDQLVFIAGAAMLGALIGFIFWNYPAGRIFLGDGGAYLVGFWLAELCILLVVRNPSVSPWFAILVLAYPVVETLFTIYRRTMLRGYSPGNPDALHFHQLIFRRLSRGARSSKRTRDAHRRNNTVAPYIWAGNALFMCPAVAFWNQDRWLVLSMVCFVAAYVWLYFRLVRGRAPMWLVPLRRS